MSFEIEEDEREWKNEWKEIRKQGDLFENDKSPEILIPKLPFKFYYKFIDDSGVPSTCLLYTSDAADERSSVDLGGRRIIKKKNKI